MDNLKNSKVLPLIIHELRSPINLILAHTNKGLKSLDNNETIRKELETINNLSQFVLLIINDILDYSKLANDKLEIHNEEFNIDDLIDQIYTMYEAQCSLKNQEFIIEKINLNVHNVIGDSMRLLTILSNVLSNATKFTDEFGNITIKIEQELLDDQVLMRFEVKDTGIGMSEEFLQDLFKPYSQEHARYGGTGLGMMMVKELVNLMKGTIIVESKKCKGTTFLINLNFDLPKKEDIALYDFSGKRVLIVDDNEVNLELTSDFLELTNISIDTAINGKEALDKFSSHDIGYYDLILMDIKMPIMDGFESTKRIRQLDRIDSKYVKIIALTAGNTDCDKYGAIKSGMNDLVTKPIDVKLLYKKINHYLYT